jgi:hypothetical protein
MRLRARQEVGKTGYAVCGLTIRINMRLRARQEVGKTGYAVCGLTIRINMRLRARSTSEKGVNLSLQFGGAWFHGTINLKGGSGFFFLRQLLRRGVVDFKSTPVLCSCIRVQICVSLCCLLSYFISLGRSKHTIQSLLFKFPRRTPPNYTGTEIPVPSDLCIGVCWLQHGWLVP